MVTAATSSPYLLSPVFLSPELSTLDMAATLYTLALWLMMMLLPNWEYTIKFLRTPFCLLPHLFLYTLSVLPTYPRKLNLFVHPANTTYSSLLLGTENLEIMATTHMLDLYILTLNLFLGRWIFWEGRHNLSHALLVVCLFLTMFTGPAGLAFYLLVSKFTEGMKLL